MFIIVADGLSAARNKENTYDHEISIGLIACRINPHRRDDTGFCPDLRGDYCGRRKSPFVCGCDQSRFDEAKSIEGSCLLQTLNMVFDCRADTSCSATFSSPAAATKGSYASPVNGGVKTGHWAAQKSATLVI